MSAYTDADVQAAAKAIARLSIQGTASWLDYSRAAVDAVAPAIAARALREVAEPMIANCDKHGHGEGASIRSNCDWCSAFGIDQDWVDRLTARAERYERTP